jgi:hypothetical protein
VLRCFWCFGYKYENFGGDMLAFNVVLIELLLLLKTLEDDEL